MSIVVKQVSKFFGKQKALDEVSFSISGGEVVGFLGPNGAGKSTMMKILSCFIPPTTGEASICGYDVLENSMEVKKKTGYLPENNPLYPDMYVREYLAFVAGIHKLKENTDKKIKEVIELTGLGPEQNKKIGSLSKGYRQRTGLAQVLIHDPEVLILDEPTSGLDPNQLIEIRNLISQVGKQKTIMLSTHIMQEVEAICDRVIIIDKGKIIADASTTDLSKLSKGRQIISLELNAAVEPSRLMEIRGVESILSLGNNKYKIETTSETDIRPGIFQFAVNHDLTVLSMQKEEYRLEEVFQQLTRKE
ncbi:MAG: gliding motility-associated ABC transporter ATP-binding subunit GldA [Bacteroidales bacterium]